MSEWFKILVLQTNESPRVHVLLSELILNSCGVFNKCDILFFALSLPAIGCLLYGISLLSLKVPKQTKLFLSILQHQWQCNFVFPFFWRT